MFKPIRYFLLTSLIIALSGCVEYQPPFDNFESKNVDFFDSGKCDKPVKHSRAQRNTIARSTIRKLGSQSVQFVHQGDRMTLIIPTDKYYLFNSPDFDDTEFSGLNDIATLLKLFPCTKIFIAGFTDNVGKPALQDKLSEARVNTMLTFLWAKGIPAQLLSPEWYGERFDIANNRIIHGSAYNRRIEIQWWAGKHPVPKSMMKMK